MIFAILIASLSVMTLAIGETTVYQQSCPCLDNTDSILQKRREKSIDCNYDWKVEGKCLEVSKDATGNGFTAYQYDYGQTCKRWKEPGHEDCFDATWDKHGEQWVIAELPPSKQKPWCLKYWCFVDPCNCDLEVKASKYVSGLYYSYQTCQTAETVSEGKNVRPDDKEPGDDLCAPAVTNNAHFLKMGFGTIFLVMGIFAQAL